MPFKLGKGFGGSATIYPTYTWPFAVNIKNALNGNGPVLVAAVPNNPQNRVEIAPIGKDAAKLMANLRQNAANLDKGKFFDLLVLTTANNAVITKGQTLVDQTYATRISKQIALSEGLMRSAGFDGVAVSKWGKDATKSYYDQASKVLSEVRDQFIEQILTHGFTSLVEPAVSFVQGIDATQASLIEGALKKLSQ